MRGAVRRNDHLPIEKAEAVHRVSPPKKRSMMALAAKPTQTFVPIQEVRDGVVVLKDGGRRAVLMVSSINFALKSEENQQAIILQFQNFLNSLDFSVQIFVQSRRLDIRPYLTLLEKRYKDQTVDLLKTQTREYIDFIKSFTESTNIMSKSFFIVVSYHSPILKASRLPFLNHGKKGQTPAHTFKEDQSQLEQRVGVVEQGLLRSGVRTVRLNTEEVVELFYNLFNPGETEKPIPEEIR